MSVLNQNCFYLNHLEIRKACLEDINSIALINHEGWVKAYRNIISSTYLDALNFEEKLRIRKQIFDSGKGIQLVAVFKGNVIGFCDLGCQFFNKNRKLTATQMEQRNEVGEIFAIYVMETYQNKGVGKALFEKGIMILREKELTPFLVWTLKDNLRSRTFYKRLGGVEVEEAPLTIGGQEYTEIAYRFEK